MVSVPIVDRAGAVVATAVWAGDLYAGVLRIEPSGPDPGRAAQVRDVVASRRDLAGVLFRSAGERPSVRGWEGWDGCLGALRVALGALGLGLGIPTGTPDRGRAAGIAAASRQATGALD